MSEKHLWALLSAGLFLALCLKWQEADSLKPPKLHHCRMNPVAHEIWLRHADGSKVFLGTSPLYLKSPIEVAETDRLIMGFCARDIPMVPEKTK